MDREVRKLLRDALDAAGEIVEYTSTVDAREFASDRMRQRAVSFAFAILGEALSQLMQKEPAVASELTDIRRSIDMRNRLIYGYASIDVGIVWATARQDIPNLREERQSLLDAG